MSDPTITILLILFAVAFFAGAIDAIAGGGGLITVPALLLAGVSPIQAIATNKFQGLFGTGTAAITFLKKGHLDIRKEWPIALLCFVLSFIGAYVASYVSSEVLEIVLPVVLISIAIYFAIQPKLDDQSKKSLLPIGLVSVAILPLVGFYDGIFGPGAGSFYMLVLVALGGHGVLSATAKTKLFNFASNLGGFVSFVFLGVISWKIGVVMACGQILGARVGANLAISKGNTIIKPMLVTICVALALKLLFWS
ncbi:hypothetical protein BFP76_10085 [Amylibacter kogurei]|uniref:Probable membrane transporter protein n=1 Tax=Paramylibacter kogurei TaxID=1889778 RepID=A0A2G5K000_9RHOB|nr:TSUP family transporter [Amylibacter kogurei]PIB22866.1 hypothetical protein BFP76_10085 [Amylibacter kogurei]